MPRILIVGQGLAGTVAALVASSRGWVTTVVDTYPAAAASRAAAGILNPVTGPRLHLSWKVDFTFPAAETFYRQWETKLAASFFQPMRVQRIFRTAAEVDFHSQRFALMANRIWLGPIAPSAQSDFGECYINAAVLDIAVFLEASRQWLLANATVFANSLNYNDLSVIADGVYWQSAFFDKVLFCEGHYATENPWFGHLPFKPAKGQSIRFQLQRPLGHEIISSEKWLLPLGGCHALAGSTYEWCDLNETPTAEGRDLLLRKVALMLPDNPVVELLDHRAGIRPCSHDRRPYVGTHPRFPQLGILNGLGSKGSLFAPWCAEQWFLMTENKTALESEIDAARCRKAWRTASQLP